MKVRELIEALKKHDQNAVVTFGANTAPGEDLEEITGILAAVDDVTSTDLERSGLALPSGTSYVDLLPDTRWKKKSPDDSSIGMKFRALRDVWHREGFKILKGTIGTIVTQYPMQLCFGIYFEGTTKIARTPLTDVAAARGNFEKVEDQQN